MQSYTDTEKTLIWNKLKRTMCGVSAICNQCGGSSRSFCECAYRRYNPSRDELDDLRRKQNDPMTDAEKAQLWQSYYRPLKPLCQSPACAGMASSHCPCAFKAFNPSRESLFQLRWDRR